MHDQSKGPLLEDDFHQGQGSMLRQCHFLFQANKKINLVYTRSGAKTTLKERREEINKPLELHFQDL
ncbi:MAG: hypothetical protein ACK518_00870 [bacterium]